MKANPKLSSSVSVVKLNDTILEFFQTNTRRQTRIRVEDDTIMNIVLALDGTKKHEELANENDINDQDLEKLLSFLEARGILDNVEPKADFEDYNQYRRVIHFLADYSHSHTHLMSMWNNIRESTVLIVGLGAVGTWIACNLVQSGVQNIIIMDGDTVESSNLHRQFGFTEADIGWKKVDALYKRLKAYSDDVKVRRVCDYLNSSNLQQFDDNTIDLIINCADKPNVDTTSLWISEYAMRRSIPHIVGGGYNLHLSLIGQTIIPGKTACFRCFQKTLEEENTIDPLRLKKLNVKNRKVGSFGPMCSSIASMVGMEAIKILSKEIEPANINRRGEFDIYAMNIVYKYYVRRKDCEWCGESGLYFH